MDKLINATSAPAQTRLATLQSWLDRTVGRTGISDRLIGITAETVPAQITCPVVTLKPDTFVSPAAGQRR